MHRKLSSAVSITIVMLRPSTPTQYQMWKLGIHDTFWTNWKSVAERSKATNSSTARRSGGTVAAAAVHLIGRLQSPGRQSTIAAPSRGMKIISVSTLSMLRTLQCQSACRSESAKESVCRARSCFDKCILSEVEGSA